LENTFRYKYHFWNKNPKATEDELSEILDETIASLKTDDGNLDRDEKEPEKKPYNVNRTGGYGKNNIKSYFTPKARINAYHERVENVEEEDNGNSYYGNKEGQEYEGNWREYENEENEDNGYNTSGSRASYYSSRGSVESNQATEFTREAMADWRDRMEERADIIIYKFNVDYLSRNKVEMDGALGTGAPLTGRDKYNKYAREGNLKCIACGDNRHNVENCYSATSDNVLSLSSLAFLDVEESDKKLSTAQDPGCSLNGQPQRVIDTLRDIIAKIRSGLSSIDREKNIQNRRDVRLLRKSGKAPVEPEKKSRILQIEGSDGKARVTTDSASIKALRQIDQGEDILAINREMMEKMKELQNDISRMKSNNESTSQERYKINAIKQVDAEEERTKGDKNTDKGVLINSIKAINGINTDGMNEELLKNERVSNRCLTYLNFTIRGIQKEDEAFTEIEKYKKKWLHDTSKESKSDDKASINIQMDNGGARTVASRAFADHCKAPPVLPILWWITILNKKGINQLLYMFEKV
jgi:hypothetical protein